MADKHIYFDARTDALAVEMIRDGGVAAILALADLFEESGAPEAAEGIRRGRLIPRVGGALRRPGRVWLEETEDDDPAVVGGEDYIDLSY